jgi:hypothetical protein
MLGGIGFLATQTLGCRVGSRLVASGLARSGDRRKRHVLTVKYLLPLAALQLLPLRRSRLVRENSCAGAP